MLPADRIRAVETGCCPHTAIRDDISANLDAVEELEAPLGPLDLVLVESGGDNLTATFSKGLVDQQIFVVDVAGGDKVPRKGGPGVTTADLLVINKTDLAPLVGADLAVMDRDAAGPPRRPADRVPVPGRGPARRRRSRTGSAARRGRSLAGHPCAHPTGFPPPTGRQPPRCSRAGRCRDAMQTTTPRPPRRRGTQRAPGRRQVRAEARLVAEADGRGGTGLSTLYGEPPLLPRRTSRHGGAVEVYLVGGAAGPLGGDDLRVDIAGRDRTPGSSSAPSPPPSRSRASRRRPARCP